MRELSNGKSKTYRGRGGPSKIEICSQDRVDLALSMGRTSDCIERPFAGGSSRLLRPHWKSWRPTASFDAYRATATSPARKARIGRTEKGSLGTMNSLVILRTGVISVRCRLKLFSCRPVGKAFERTACYGMWPCTEKDGDFGWPTSAHGRRNRPLKSNVKTSTAGSRQYKTRRNGQGDSISEM